MPVSLSVLRDDSEHSGKFPRHPPDKRLGARIRDGKVTTKNRIPVVQTLFNWRVSVRQTLRLWEVGQNRELFKLNVPSDDNFVFSLILRCGVLSRYWKEGAADGVGWISKSPKIDYVKDRITARGEVSSRRRRLGFYSSFAILYPPAREMKGWYWGCGS